MNMNHSSFRPNRLVFQDKPTAPEGGADIAGDKPKKPDFVDKDEREKLYADTEEQIGKMKDGDPRKKELKDLLGLAQTHEKKIPRAAEYWSKRLFKKLTTIAPEPTAEAQKKDPEELLLSVAKDILKDAHRDAVLKLIKHVEEANAKKAGGGGRDLEEGEKFPTHQDKERWRVRNQHPNLAKIYDQIDGLKANPGETVSEIQAAAKEIKSLSRRSIFRKAIDTDLIESKLRYAVDTAETKSKKGKEYNEMLIRRKIRRQEEPLFSAKEGASWDVKTSDGFFVRITKGEHHDYSVDITGLSENGRGEYRVVANDLGLAPLPGKERGKVPPTAVAAAPAKGGDKAKAAPVEKAPKVDYLRPNQVPPDVKAKLDAANIPVNGVGKYPKGKYTYIRKVGGDGRSYYRRTPWQA